MKKRGLKKFLTMLIMLCTVVGSFASWTYAAGNTARYDGGYGIDSLLSQFQFFVKSDVTLNNSGHTVGSVAVGGTLDLSNSFGDAGIVPSYVNCLKNGYVGNGWHGAVPVKNSTVYYDTKIGGSTDSNWYQNADYMDMRTAFTAIARESLALSNMEGAVNLSRNNGSIVIDLTNVTEDKVFKISYSEFSQANNINIKVRNADWFRDHLCLINITGASSTDFLFDGYSKIQINGNGIETGLEAMSGADAEFGKQLNISGMNLVWNFPDASGTINVQGLGGHFVAPNATVDLVSGNYEGGIICSKLTGGAEGHFYPMSKSLSAGSAGAITATATFSKKAVSAAGSELAGASMKLSYVAGTNNLSGVRRESGPDITVGTDKKTVTWTSSAIALTLSGLPEGEYVLAETAAPQGYKYATDIGFKVDADGKIYQKNENGTYSTSSVTTLTMVDEAKAGSIKLKGTKKITGLATGDSVSKVYHFTVKEGGSEVATGSVTGAGTIEFTEIRYNSVGTHTYEITEVNPGLSDMTYDSREITVVVKVSDDGGRNSNLKAEIVSAQSDEIVFTNINNATTPAEPDVTATVSFRKCVDSEDGAKLSGAKLRLKQLSGKNNLAAVTCSAGQSVSKDTANSYIEWTTSGTDVTLANLPFGKYILSEIETPSGYQKAEDIQISVGQDGKVSYTNLAGTGISGTGITVCMVDKVKTGNLSLSGTKKLIGGSIDETFDFVVTEGSTVVSTGSVNGAGTIQFNPITINTTVDHTYTITETSGSTSGMTYDSSSKTVKVHVEDDGGADLKVTIDSSSDPIEFTNKYQPSTPAQPNTTTATFSKKAVSKDGAELPGASIKLTYNGSSDLRHVAPVSGPSIVIEGNNNVVTWVSTSTPLKLQGLPDGEYVMTETGAPDGYEYATDIAFKIENGKVYQKLSNGNYSEADNPVLTMVDEAKPGNLEVTVYDEKTGKIVPGAEVKITNPDNETTKYTTDANGKIRISDTIPGKYDIEVIQVPEGFEVTLGKTETVTVKPGQTVKHDVYINNSPDDETTTEDTTGGGSGSSNTSNTTDTTNTPDTSVTTDITNTPNTSVTTNTTNTSNTTSTNTSVKTGDAFHMGILILFMVVSAGMILVLLRRKQEKTKIHNSSTGNKQ